MCVCALKWMGWLANLVCILLSCQTYTDNTVTVCVFCGRSWSCVFADHGVSACMCAVRKWGLPCVLAGPDVPGTGKVVKKYSTALKLFRSLPSMWCLQPQYMAAFPTCQPLMHSVLALCCKVACLPFAARLHLHAACTWSTC